MRPLVKLAVLLPLAGCHQPGPYDQYGGIPHRGPAPVGVISTNADSYRAGAPVSIRLTNTTGRAVGYNLCRASLERDSDEGWRQTQQTLGEVCTAELRTLRPGQSATFVFTPSPRPRAGDYRIRAVLHDPRGGVPLEVVSNAFNLARESD